MNEILELKNIEIKEYCVLDKKTGTKKFMEEKKIPGFSGLYFKDNDNFFAVYPTVNGPKVYFQGKEYDINKTLTISLEKLGENRKFNIVEYGIEVKYLESPYIGLDVWSDEIDVDLFYMITQNYKSNDFYTRYTSNV